MLVVSKSSKGVFFLDHIVTGGKKRGEKGAGAGCEGTGSVPLSYAMCNNQKNSFSLILRWAVRISIAQRRRLSSVSTVSTSDPRRRFFGTNFVYPELLKLSQNKFEFQAQKTQLSSYAPVLVVTY